MNVPLIQMILFFIAGMALGLFYFGGLWLTLEHLKKTEHPYLFTLLSFFGRTAAALVCFYLIVREGRLDRLITALVGFILIRVILIRMKGPEKKSPKKDPGKVAKSG